LNAYNVCIINTQIADLHIWKKQHISTVTRLAGITHLSHAY